MISQKTFSATRRRPSVWFFFGFALKCFAHCICCPHRCCRRSRWLRHTPSAWGCSGGSRTQTEQRSKIHLERNWEKIKHNWFFWYFFKKKTKKRQGVCVAGLAGFLRGSLRADVPQWTSSAPFSQSFSLSHVQLMGMQRPLGQAKKGVGHFVLLLPWRERRKKTS